MSRIKPNAGRFGIAARVDVKSAVIALFSAYFATSTPVFGQFKPTAALTVKETYDSNIFLEDRGPIAQRASMITTVNPTVGLDYKTNGLASTKLTLNYSPELAYFHSEHSEDFVRHNLAGTVTATQGPWQLDSVNTVIYTDGPHTSPTWGKIEGGPPSITATAVRDRRDQVIYRNSVALKYSADPFFIRPVFNSWVQDFNVAHSTAPGYLNWADRTDINAGVDIGYRVLPDMYLVTGYRYGQQTQESIQDNPLHYNNAYQRVLAGVEGKPAPWLKVALLAGPDFRRFGSAVADDFGRFKTDVWIDGAITVSPTSNDDISFITKRSLVPSSVGHGLMDDNTYSATWKHHEGFHWLFTAGFRLYGGECDPVRREDWLYEPSAGVTYRFDQHTSLEASYIYDQSESDTPRSSGHEYHRHAVTMGLQYSL
jgi:hypothetical protein